MLLASLALAAVVRNEEGRMVRNEEGQAGSISISQCNKRIQGVFDEWRADVTPLEAKYNDLKKKYNDLKNKRKS